MRITKRPQPNRLLMGDLTRYQYYRRQGRLMLVSGLLILAFALGGVFLSPIFWSIWLFVH